MPKRILQGVVVSDKGDKTIIVNVERRIMHPLYKKFISRTKRYAAHDAENRFKIGDRVRIEECPPISKSKKYAVIYDAAAGAAKKTTSKPAAKGAATADATGATAQATTGATTGATTEATTGTES